MSYHALVIDDSPEILEDVKDRLDSLGHTCDCASSQEQARELATSNGYSYVLLDLEIPFKYGRPSRILNGQNLLKDIKGTRGHADIPIIVMTSYGHDSPDLATKVMRGNGASDYVKKPFPDWGRTLEKAIRDALASSGRSRPGAARQSEPQQGEVLQPFEDGEMVFYPTHVELCEVKICGAVGKSQIRSILDELKAKDQKGRFVRYSAKVLAKKISCIPGENAVATAVRDFRNNASTALLAEKSVQVDYLEDIILNDRKYGYRLSKKITVRDHDDPVRDPANEPNDPDPDPVVDPDSPLNERQEWILNQLRDRHPLQKKEIMAQFKCSESTAKRDLAKLEAKELVKFVGAKRTGHYELVKPVQAEFRTI